MHEVSTLPKKEAIVLAAKQAFLELGFQHATMDDIAERAGTTKRTVYNHFRNKEELFHAVVGEVSRLFLAKLPPPDPGAADIGAELARFAARFSELCTWTDAVALQRALLAEARQFPDLCRQLYESVARAAEDILADYLGALAVRGRLEVDDPRAAGCVLLSAATAGARFRTLYGVDPPLAGPPSAELSAQVDMAPVRRAVAAFLTVHGKG